MFKVLKDFKGSPDGYTVHEYVAGQEIEIVVGDPGRLVAEVVAPEVRGDDPEAGDGEGRDLVAPREPELGEAVEEEDQGARLGPLFDVVDLEAVDREEGVAHRG